MQIAINHDEQEYIAYFGAGGTQMIKPAGGQWMDNRTELFATLLAEAVKKLGYQKHVEYDEEIQKLEPCEDHSERIGSLSNFHFEGDTYFVSATGYNGRETHGGPICNEPWVTPIIQATVLLGNDAARERRHKFLESLPTLHVGQRIWVKHYGFHTVDISKTGRCVFIRERDGKRTTY